MIFAMLIGFLTSICMDVVGLLFLTANVKVEKKNMLSLVLDYCILIICCDKTLDNCICILVFVI